MKIIRFNELKVGDRFIMNGKECTILSITDGTAFVKRGTTGSKVKIGAKSQQWVSKVDPEEKDSDDETHEGRPPSDYTNTSGYVKLFEKYKK